MTILIFEILIMTDVIIYLSLSSFLNMEFLYPNLHFDLLKYSNFLVSKFTAYKPFKTSLFNSYAPIFCIGAAPTLLELMKDFLFQIGF